MESDSYCGCSWSDFQSGTTGADILKEAFSHIICTALNPEFLEIVFAQSPEMDGVRASRYASLRQLYDYFNIPAKYQLHLRYYGDITIDSIEPFLKVSALCMMNCPV